MLHGDTATSPAGRGCCTRQRSRGPTAPVCAGSARTQSSARARISSQHITYWLWSGMDFESGSFITCKRRRAVSANCRARDPGALARERRAGAHLAVENAGLCPRRAGLHLAKVAVRDVLRRWGARVADARVHSRTPRAERPGHARGVLPPFPMKGRGCAPSCARRLPLPQRPRTAAACRRRPRHQRAAGAARSPASVATATAPCAFLRDLSRVRGK